MIHLFEKLVKFKAKNMMISDKMFPTSGFTLHQFEMHNERRKIRYEINAKMGFVVPLIY